MDYLTGSFAPLILLSPVLIALAVAIFLTYRISARIARRNAQEEQDRLKKLGDEGKERDVFRNMSAEDKAQLQEVIREAESLMHNNPHARVLRPKEKSDEKSDIESHGKSA